MEQRDAVGGPFGRRNRVGARCPVLLALGVAAWVAAIPCRTALATPVQEQDTVVVKGFRFTGNTSIPTAELEALLAPYVGRSCDLKTLREAAEKVSEEYGRRGLNLAKAYLPAQDAKEGIIEIVVLEGKLGEIHVEGNRNYSADFIRDHIRRALSDGPVTSDRLEQALLLLNEFRDLKVTAVLDRGKEPGTVDIRAKVEDRFPLHTTLSYNNFGSDLVGRHRFGVEFDWTDAILPGALFTLGGIVGERPDDLAFGTGRYIFPVNSLGTKVGLNGAFGTYDVTQQLADLGISGEMAAAGVSVIHPFLKSRTVGLSVEVGFQWKDTEFFLLGETSSRDKINFLYVTASADWVHWGGKSFGTVNITQGLGDFLGGLEEDSPDASRLDADNSFTRFTGSLVRFQPLSDLFSIFARVSGQWSIDSLVSGEEWQIGGISTVRGYGPGETSGDDGYNAGLEFRVTPLENRETLQFVAFVDHGGAYRKKPTVGQESTTHLTGAGVGVRSHLPFDFVEADLRFELGWPIDPDDNSLDEGPVIYASAVVRF